jgi:hypothetical protein
MVRKGAMIRTAKIIAFQWLKEAGTEEFKRLSKLLEQKSTLNQVKQLGKEVREEEGIGKHECPDSYPFRIDLNPSCNF